MCETKLASGQIIKNTLPNYEICSRTKKIGEKGIALCVRKNTFQSVLDVTTTKTEDIVVVRVEMVNIALRIILAYAPQENEVAETREQFFSEVEVEIAECKMADELPILIGDLNAKIELNEGKIEELTSNGRHLAQLIENQQLDVLNFNKKCSGKWTHVIRTSNSSYVFDYVLTSKEVTNTVESVIIDEECLMCPFSLKKKNNVEETQFSDHNAIVVRLLMEHNKKNEVNKAKSWRITKEGLQKLIEITNDTFDNSKGSNTQQ